MRETNFRWMAGLALTVLAFGAGGTENSNSWAEALSSAYQESFRKDEGDAVTSSVACFDETVVEGQDCKLIALVYHDAFREMRVYTPRQTHLSSYTPEPYLRSEIFLMDCKQPIYVLQPYYFSKSKALLLHTATVELEGKVVYERKIAAKNVHRKRASYGIEETADLIADEQAIAGLRQIAKGGKTVIRLTGDKGHAAVPQKEAKKFGLDVADALRIYDKLSAGVTPDVQKSCLAAK